LRHWLQAHAGLDGVIYGLGITTCKGTVLSFLRPENAGVKLKGDVISQRLSKSKDAVGEYQGKEMGYGYGTHYS